MADHKEQQSLVSHLLSCTINTRHGGSSATAACQWEAESVCVCVCMCVYVHACVYMQHNFGVSDLNQLRSESDLNQGGQVTLHCIALRCIALHCVALHVHQPTIMRKLVECPVVASVPRRSVVRYTGQS